jgi:hypothetical protein
MGLISLWDFTYSGAEHFQTIVNRLPDVNYLIRTAHWSACLEEGFAFLNYVSKRIDPSTHVSLAANNEHTT